jgi:hypothetical protein
MLASLATFAVRCQLEGVKSGGRACQRRDNNDNSNDNCNNLRLVITLLLSTITLPQIEFVSQPIIISL